MIHIILYKETPPMSSPLPEKCGIFCGTHRRLRSGNLKKPSAKKQAEFTRSGLGDGQLAAFFIPFHAGSDGLRRVIQRDPQ